MLRRIGEPSAEPVTVPEVKGNARVDWADEDPDIDAWLRAERVASENATQRAYLTQTWELVLPGFPPGREPIRLERPPVQEVTEVTYVDADGETQTLGAEERQLVADAPGRLYPAPGERWPATERDNPAAVTVRFKAGYGDDPEDVPEDLRDAIVLRATTRYRQREDEMVGTIRTERNAVAALERAYIWDTGVG